MAVDEDGLVNGVERNGGEARGYEPPDELDLAGHVFDPGALAGDLCDDLFLLQQDNRVGVAAEEAGTAAVEAGGSARPFLPFRTDRPVT
ncbi:hypothetical protein [Streptomyces ardesiacus]|uniref:hypothetical protein n=1 Tax=Streptomyces ardesiacus TaxID=285564 RepID=UPI0036535B2B